MSLGNGIGTPRWRTHWMAWRKQNSSKNPHARHRSSRWSSRLTQGWQNQNKLAASCEPSGPRHISGRACFIKHFAPARGPLLAHRSKSLIRHTTRSQQDPCGERTNQEKVLEEIGYRRWLHDCTRIIVERPSRDSFTSTTNLTIQRRESTQGMFVPNSNFLTSANDWLLQSTIIVSPGIWVATILYVPILYLSQ